MVVRVKRVVGAVIWISLMVSGFSGCLGSGAPTEGFQPVFERAQEHAVTWRPEARLAGAGTIEAKDLSIVQERWALANVVIDLQQNTQKKDSRIGDGRGVYWHFVFQDPATGDHLALAFMAQGQDPVYEEEYGGSVTITTPGVSGPPLLDSTSNEVQKSIKSQGGIGDFLVSDPEAILLTVLAPSPKDGTPEWIFLAFGENGHLVMVVAGDTGKLSRFGEFPFMEYDLFNLFWFTGSGGPGAVLHAQETDGRLSLVEPEQTYSFPVNASDFYGREVRTTFGVCSPAGSPTVKTGSARYEVTGPDGQELTSGMVAHGELVGGYTYSQQGWSGLDPGDYTVRFSIDSPLEPVPMAFVDYRFMVIVATTMPSLKLVLVFPSFFEDWCEQVMAG